MKVQRVVHYTMNDKHFDGDYVSVVVLEGIKILGSWEDDYHDKGWDKSCGFIEGMRVFSPVDVEEFNVADRGEK